MFYNIFAIADPFVFLALRHRNEKSRAKLLLFFGLCKSYVTFMKKKHITVLFCALLFALLHSYALSRAYINKVYMKNLYFFTQILAYSKKKQYLCRVLVLKDM